MWGDLMASVYAITLYVSAVSLFFAAVQVLHILGKGFSGREQLFSFTILFFFWELKNNSGNKKTGSFGP